MTVNDAWKGVLNCGSPAAVGTMYARTGFRHSSLLYIDIIDYGEASMGF